MVLPRWREHGALIAAVQRVPPGAEWPGMPPVKGTTTMYYQIEGTNVRLAGSMHTIPKGTMIPSWTWEAYRWSEVLYLEHDHDDLKNHAFMLDERTENRVPPQLWSRMQAAWPANGMLDCQKLWVVTMLLATADLGLVPGVEIQLRERMSIDSRTPLYLETVASFSALLECIPDAIYVSIIDKVLNNHAERVQGIADVYAAWISGRIENVESVMQRLPLAQFTEVREAIFDTRNLAWLPRIINLLASERRTLIFVGAGHLVGPSGLLALLQQHGKGHRPLA